MRQTDQPVTVRARAYGRTGLHGDWITTTFTTVAPVVQGELIEPLSIQIEKMSAQLQKDIGAINDLGRGTLALGQQLTGDALDAARLALDLANDTLRGADRQLAALVDHLAAQQATQAGNAFEERQLLKVADGRNFAAIERETRLRVSGDEVLASITTSLAVRLDVAEGGIVGNASAIQGLSTRVLTAEGVITAQSQSITQLSSRIDANDLALSGQATAVQSLTTRVTLTEGNISSLSESLTALGSTVTTQGGQIGANATAIDRVSTRAEQIDGRVTSEAQRTTALEASVSDQGAEIVGQARALDDLSARTSTTEGRVTSVANRTTALESSVSAQGGQIGANAQALQDLTTRTSATEQGLSAQAQQLTNLSSTVSGQGGQIGANAQAVSQLQTRADNVDGQLSSQASSIQSLSTTVNGHTATLTTYGTSINGVQAQYGVAIDLDGQTGGFVLTGIKKLDGSASFSFKLSADLFVDGGITSRMVSTTSLITTTAQIGTLTVDNISVKDGAISGLVSAQSSGQQASVTITVRTARAVSILAFRTGDLSSRYPQNTTNTGAIKIYRNGNLIGAIPANFTLDWDNSLRANYMRLGPTAYPILDTPGVGSHTYQAVDDNNVNVGGVYISVQESK